MANILVVDDDEFIRDLLRNILEAEEHVVAAAADGKQAIKIFRHQPADVVITDILMPGQEGLETIAQLKSMVPAPKIIAISGGGRYGPVGYLDAAESLGADRAIAKPIDRRTLLGMIEELLEEKDRTTPV